MQVGWVNKSNSNDSRQISAPPSAEDFGPLTLVAAGESRRGAVAWAIRHRPVSPPRSSNRSRGYPASGSPTGLTARCTGTVIVGWCLATTPRLGDQHRLAAELARKPCDLVWCLSADRQPPILGSLESAPEVRALSSAGFTLPQRNYGPVRLPPGPPCSPRRCHHSVGDSTSGRNGPPRYRQAGRHPHLHRSKAGSGFNGKCYLAVKGSDRPHSAARRFQIARTRFRSCCTS